jgi:hypothetical protein
VCAGCPGVKKQNTSEGFDRLNILAPNILATKEGGKNMVGKNIIEILARSELPKRA